MISNTVLTKITTLLFFATPIMVMLIAHNQNSSFLAFSINLFPLLVLLFIAYIYGYSNNNHQLNNPNTYNNYVKPLVFYCLSSLTIASIIISMQSTVLSHYDNDFSKKNKFKWLKTEEILNFPLTQYKLVNQLKGNKIDLEDSGYNSNEKLHIFVIDKTKSIDTFSCKDRNDKFCETLDRYNVEYNKNVNLLGTSYTDKTMLFLINKILYNNKHDELIAIFFYDGIDSMLIPVKENFIYNKTKDTDIENSIAKAYDEKRKLLSLKNQKTDLNKLINTIATQLKSKMFINHKNISLSLLTDLNDDVPDANELKYYRK